MSQEDEPRANQASTSTAENMNLPTVSMFQSTVLKDGLKLKQGNFAAWLNRLECQLGMYNAQNVLKEDCPSEKPQKDAFTRLDNFAKVLIIDSVDLSEVQGLHNFKTSKEMLSFLKQKYSEMTDSRIYTLRAKIYDFKVSESDPLDACLKKIMEAYNQLKDLGCAPQDVEMVSAILKGLPPSYKPLAMILRQQKPLHLSTLLNALKEKMDS